MSFPIQLKNRVRAKLTHKKLLTASAASAVMLMAATPAAHAQVVDINDCSDFLADNASNPGVGDAGVVVNIDTEANCVIDGNDHIELDAPIRLIYY